MFAREKYKIVIALFLVLLLMNPLLVKSLHCHQDDQRHCNNFPAEGINPVHPHHENCEICGFEYVNVLPEESTFIQVHSQEITDILIPSAEPCHSASLLFASPRAPPVSL